MRTKCIIYSVVCLFVLTACSGNQPPGKQIAPFSFTDQNGLSFGTDDLAGTVWVASFIFTSCETVCPPMMFEMASLQEIFKEKGIQVEFVSFTVDPEIDSPEVLEQYIQHFTDDETNWHMLSGYTQETIENLAREQFQTIVQKPDSSNQVIHGTNFYLVDDQGYLVNEYNYIDETYVEEMMKDIKKIR
jgi:protein SCO1/2